MIVDKLKYLLDSLIRQGDPLYCPSCKNDNGFTLVDTKYFVTKLYKCNSCKLQFRFPLDSKKTNEKFYQFEYVEEGDNFTTHMPSDLEIEELKKINFNSSSNRSIERVIPIVQSFYKELTKVKLIDYGASWGYMSYQFKQLGMHVQSYEISIPRAQFGNTKLGLDIKTNSQDLSPEQDVFFSSHVIEHVPVVSEFLSLAKSKLAKDGIVVIICPNGSDEFRVQKPNNFHTNWGKVHPNFLDAEFFMNYYKNNPYYIGTFPMDLNNFDNLHNQKFENLQNDELVVIAQPNIGIK